MLHLIELALASYIICKIIVDGSLFENARVWIERKTPFLHPNVECPDYKHWIRCRLCFGITATIFAFILDAVTLGFATHFLSVAGLAFLFVFQERSSDVKEKQIKSNPRKRTSKPSAR
jgi:hypothetical protein